MNEARRKKLEKAIELLDHAKNLVHEALDGEQEYFDNMPEGLQGGEKGEKAQEAIEQLESTTNSLEEAIYNLQSII